jgi:hypothetical protein
MAALAQASPQEADLKKKLGTVSLPKGVHFKSAFLDVDYSGDAAVYVVYSVSKQLGLGPARIRSLNDLRERVTEVVDAMHLDRMAYVRFVDVK